MKTIYTVQHTESEHHTNGMVGSWTDWCLTELGKQQADNIAVKLKQELDGKEVVLYTSDLKRAKQTADSIATQFKVTPIEKKELRERNLGKCCGKSVQWLRENLECDEKTIDDRLFSDAESRRDEWNRLKPFFDQERFVNGLDKPFILNLADKRKLNKAFKGSNFEFTERKKGQGTFNELMCYGPHNYKFEVGIDRTHGMPRSFKAYLRIYGYNFSISNEFEMCADSCEEAQEILNELAKFCMELQDDFFEELASAFGDTPKWFWEKD